MTDAVKDGAPGEPVDHGMGAALLALWRNRDDAAASADYGQA
jgi:hypothetical protein